MKKNIFMYLIIGTAFLFFGCTEDSILVDEMNQKSDENISAKVARTDFDGTCKFIEYDNPGTFDLLPFGMGLLKGQISQWEEVATDPRVTGISTWIVNAKIQNNGNRTFRGGKAELSVAGDGGTWDISWHGWFTLTVDGPPEIVAYATGVGKKGDVKGLVAKWTYTFIWDDAYPPLGGYYETHGYIQSKE